MRRSVFLATLVALSFGVTGCGSSDNVTVGQSAAPPPPPPPPPTTVSGKVTDNGGMELDDYVVLSFLPVGGGEATEVAVGTDGTYSSDIAAGDFTVLASRPGYEGLDTPFTVAGEQDNTLDLSLTGKPVDEYATSEDCAACHATYYDSFVQSGHPYKLNKVEGAVPPEYPFTSLDGVLERVTDEDALTDNSLGTPAGWDSVTYVIGGYNWKARFIDADGYIVTGSEVQYNFETDGMSGYHDDEVDKPYNCGNCHTTGWRHQDDVLNDARQDDLPGMHGTFAISGIGCESCHGIGTRHAQTADPGDIVADATPRLISDLQAPDAGFGKPVSCGECHTRDGERDYSTYLSKFDIARMGIDEPMADQGGRIAASGGLIRHHEQFDEMLGIDPDDPLLATTRSNSFLATHGFCTTCHEPHGSVVFQDDPAYTGLQGVDKTDGTCLTCHPRYSAADRTGGMLSLNCTNCHMPKMSKSAVSHAAVGEGPVTGDISSHLFRINMDSTAEQFSDGFAKPYVTVDWACRTCHNNVDLFGMPDFILDDYVFHNNVEFNP